MVHCIKNCLIIKSFVFIRTFATMILESFSRPLYTSSVKAFDSILFDFRGFFCACEGGGGKLHSRAFLDLETSFVLFAELRYFDRTKGVFVVMFSILGRCNAKFSKKTF